MKWLNTFIENSITVSEADIPVDLIAEVGINGNYLSEDHTAENFRNNIWLPDLMERSIVDDAGGMDRVIENAKQKWSDFMKKDIEPCISEDKVKEIEKWKQRAIKIITNKF